MIGTLLNFWVEQTVIDRVFLLFAHKQSLRK
jgi:hypothetical protein